MLCVVYLTTVTLFAFFSNAHRDHGSPIMAVIPPPTTTDLGDGFILNELSFQHETEGKRVTHIHYSIERANSFVELDYLLENEDVAFCTKPSQNNVTYLVLSPVSSERKEALAQSIQVGSTFALTYYHGCADIKFARVAAVANLAATLEIQLEAVEASTIYRNCTGEFHSDHESVFLIKKHHERATPDGLDDDDTPYRDSFGDTFGFTTTAAEERELGVSVHAELPVKFYLSFDIRFAALDVPTGILYLKGKLDGAMNTNVSFHINEEKTYSTDKHTLFYAVCPLAAFPFISAGFYVLGQAKLQEQAKLDGAVKVQGPFSATLLFDYMNTPPSNFKYGAAYWYYADNDHNLTTEVNAELNISLTASIILTPLLELSAHIVSASVGVQVDLSAEEKIETLPTCPDVLVHCHKYEARAKAVFIAAADIPFIDDDASHTFGTSYHTFWDNKSKCKCPA